MNNGMSFQQLTENKNAGTRNRMWNRSAKFRVHIDKPQWPTLIDIKSVLLKTVCVTLYIYIYIHTSLKNITKCTDSRISKKQGNN